MLGAGTARPLLFLLIVSRVTAGACGTAGARDVRL
jgi:hypothetical protein